MPSISKYEFSSNFAFTANIVIILDNIFDEYVVLVSLQVLMSAGLPKYEEM